jgi:predicted  nucleic acid-binding Zn-ribbon protein
MDAVEAKVQHLYKLAKEYPDDERLQTAVAAVKSLRRSRGSLQSWNSRYRQEVGELQSEIQVKDQEKLALEQELDKVQQEVHAMVAQKQRLLAERERVQAELRHIQTEVELAAVRVKETHGWYGKFTILWTFINSVFFDDGDRPEMGKIETSVKPDPDRPQMQTDPASIGKDLLDR